MAMRREAGRRALIRGSQNDHEEHERQHHLGQNAATMEYPPGECSP